MSYRCLLVTALLAGCQVSTGSGDDDDGAVCEPACLDGETCVDGVCMTPATACDPDPCENGGLCYASAGGTYCDCPGGFTGATCADVEADPCDPSPCLNGGTCASDGPARHSGHGATRDVHCACPAGFDGATCEIDLDDCAANPCLNGGCTDGVDSFACACAVGFEGATCATDVDDCAPNPCANGGSCADGVAGFTCTCAAQWAGTTCEVELVGCEPNPCLHGGTCSDTDGIACACPSGWEGPICELDVDDCAEAPCLNGGTCVDGLDTFTCTCAEGFGGLLCESNDDDCEGEPCLNGGDCLDAVAGFTCACAAGFGGPLCAQPVLTGTLADVADGCPEETFLDPGQFAGPGASYPDPALAVTCTATTMTVVTNNLPHYTYVPQGAPGDLTAQNLTLRVPLQPVWQETPIDTAVTGDVGVAANGCVILTPSEAEDLGWGDPVSDGVTDDCRGHIAPGGMYHYHGVAQACFAPVDGAAPSPQLGWIYDGYPIYGPYDCLDAGCAQVVEMLSSYSAVNDAGDCARQSFAYAGDADEHADGDVYLDRCNGHVGPDGSYHYHATNGYPWTVGCFHGAPSTSAKVAGGLDDTQFEATCTGGVYTGDEGGGGDGPAPCDEESDCTSACPPESAGCTCAATPMGDRCLPTCSGADDCPPGPGGATLVCNPEGVCTPPPPH